MVARLISEADVTSGRAGDPIVIDRDTAITPSALDAARLRGIRVIFARDTAPTQNAPPPTAPAHASAPLVPVPVPAPACACPPQPAPTSRPSPASPASAPRQPAKPWAIPFDRRGIDPALFRRAPRPAQAPSQPQGHGAPAHGEPQSPPSTHRERAAVLIALSGADAPGRLAAVLREVEALGPVLELRQRTAQGMLEATLVVCAPAGADTSRVEARLAALGLLVVLHAT